MTGAAPAAAIAAPMGNMLHGATSALSGIIGDVFWGVTQEFEWLLVLCAVAAAAISAALYMATPKSCPICRTRT